MEKGEGRERPSPFLPGRRPYRRQSGPLRQWSEVILDQRLHSGLVETITRAIRSLTQYLARHMLITLRGRPRTSSAGKDSAGREAVLYSKLYR